MYTIYRHVAVFCFPGVTVLVTHLERKPLDPVYRGLLLKQFYVDKDGQRVVKIGHREFKYHPQFALYLSTSVPLFLKGNKITYERERERGKQKNSCKSENFIIVVYGITDPLLKIFSEIIKVIFIKNYFNMKKINDNFSFCSMFPYFEIDVSLNNGECAYFYRRRHSQHPPTQDVYHQHGPE